MSDKISKKNGKKGGRPVYASKLCVKIPNIDLVILTPNQYATLIKKYGYEVLNRALYILEQWLKTSPDGERYRGKNNYAHFRSDGWLINSAMDF